MLWFGRVNQTLLREYCTVVKSMYLCIYLHILQKSNMGKNKPFQRHWNHCIIQFLTKYPGQFSSHHQQCALYWLSHSSYRTSYIASYHGGRNTVVGKLMHHSVNHLFMKSARESRKTIDLSFAPQYYTMQLSSFIEKQQQKRHQLDALCTKFLLVTLRQHFSSAGCLSYILAGQYVDHCAASRFPRK